MTFTSILKVFFVAISLGLDVFAVGVGVGMGGVDRGTKIRIGVAFTLAEVTMTLVGAGLGKLAGDVIGDVAGYLGFAALVGVGIYMIYEASREHEAGGFDLSHGWGLFLGAISISIDSLGIGFSILYIGVPLVVSIVCIAIVSGASTTIGLTLGKVLGKRAEGAAAHWAGIILIATGVGFAALKYFEI